MSQKLAATNYHRHRRRRLDIDILTWLFWPTGWAKNCTVNFC